MHDINKKMQKGSGQPKGRKQFRRARSSQADGFAIAPLAAQSTRVVCRTLGIPKFFQCKFRMGVQGYLPAASPATGQALINGNVYFGPFNTVNSITTGWNLSLTDGSSTVGLFPGYAMMLAGYATYRVLRSRLVVTAVNGNSGDGMNVWIMPVPLANAAVTKYQAALGNAGTKACMTTSGCRPLTLVSDVNAWDVLGFTKAQYQAAGFAEGAIAGVPSGSQTTAWQVSYATMDGGVTTGQSYFDFQVEYDVEFINPLTQEA
jgi:hypothetical protein